MMMMMMMINMARNIREETERLCHRTLTSDVQFLQPLRQPALSAAGRALHCEPPQS